MAALSHKLALVIADRLKSVVPDGITVRASSALVDVSAFGTTLHASSAAAIVADENAEPFLRRLEVACSAILGGAQDCIATLLRKPWPISSSGEMAMPKVRADETHLHLWYGDLEHSPTLALRPILLAELTAGD